MTARSCTSRRRELCGSLGEYKASLSAARARTASARIARRVAGGAREAGGRERARRARARRRGRERCSRAALAAAAGSTTAGCRRGARRPGNRAFATRRHRGRAALLRRGAGATTWRSVSNGPPPRSRAHLAEVEFAAGDAAAALQRAEEARAGHEATHNRRSLANDLVQHGCLSRGAGLFRRRAGARGAKRSRRRAT